MRRYVLKEDDKYLKNIRENTTDISKAILYTYSEAQDVIKKLNHRKIKMHRK